MESLKELYRIGKGPSSSHTMGPENFAKNVKQLYGDEYDYKAVLFGSLAMTGKGHGTDRVLKEVLGEKAEVVFDSQTKDLPHPNTLDIEVSKNGKIINRLRGMSVGGGKIVSEDANDAPNEVYSINTFTALKEHLGKFNLRIFEYAFLVEPDLKEYLAIVWQTMKQSVQDGLNKDGILPGGLNLPKKAHSLFTSITENETTEARQRRLIYAYTMAVAEENADNGRIVTAPTCGSCGVMPGVLYYMQTEKGFSDEKIINAIATAGIIGNIVKKNSSLSGAECGCQAEIGTACSMAAAALAELNGLSLDQIECAAEVGMEHNLGLTCDPVMGLVQVPCIERNALAGMRAFDAYYIAHYLAEKSKVSFDIIVKTMYETGLDLGSRYKETSTGGIAKYFDRK